MKASNSNSNLSRPSSSKSKPGTPRSRSRPREREFMLWIPEPLENLENIIQSKQRTLDLLNYQTETLEKEIQDQLSARDRYINELNRSILELRSELKTREGSSNNNRNWEKELEGQELAYLDSRKNNNELKGKLKELQEDFERAIKEWEEEKEKLETSKNLLEEDEEEIKGTLEVREIEINELIESNKILQSANQKLIALNTELLANGDKVNNEIQSINSKYYETNRIAARAKELQKTLEEYLSLNLELEARHAKNLRFADHLGKLMKISEWVDKNLQNINENAKIRESSLNKAGPENFGAEIYDLKVFLNDTISKLQTIRLSVANNTPNVNSEDKTSEEILRTRIVEIKNDQNKLLEDYNEIKASENGYIDEINGLNEHIKRNAAGYSTNIAKIKAQIDIMKEVTEQFNQRIENLKKNNEKTQAELYAAKSKLAHQAGKDEHFQKKKKEFHDFEALLKAENNELKNKIGENSPENKATAKNSTSEEIRVKKAMLQLQVLRDEIFRKDTDLVKKAREMVKMEKDIQSQKVNNQKLNSKLKTIEAEIITKVSQDLEEKDRQIDILKEMLRCAHSDLKLKESQIVSLKNNERMTSPRNK